MKINFIFRNNPDKHPVLSEITQDIVFEKVSFSGITFYINLDPAAKFVCIDDPIVFIYLLSNKTLKKLKIIFYSLELYEKQISNNSLYNICRNALFYWTNYLTQRKSHTIIFPSKLRKDYFHNRSFIQDKSEVIYNKPDFSKLKIGTVSNETKEWIETQKQKQKQIVIYAGGIQEGRAIEKVVNSINDDSDYAILLVGPISNDLIRKKFNSSPNILYLGTLPRTDVFALYLESDFGLLNYSNHLKNSELCAPIKIWEYKEFNLKILANYDNKALVEEWNPLIDAYYFNNNLFDIKMNSTKNTNSYKNMNPMHKAFWSLINKVSNS